ncbi:hypothetical protein [Paraburkholderia sp. HD33-4]|uniref:hypothetical protein n=1 Tax=Paraburkholderia sp. HD33-4 TaxID=2883242 RepID=UPI001F3BB8C6|nr:hypothetical protein [Paraburkholderia sp. HD33-4]
MSDQAAVNSESIVRFEGSTLQRTGMTRRLNSLFKAMASDFLLRDQFVTDPTKIIAEYVRGVELSYGNASVSNQLLYSVLSNRSLRSWLISYAIEHRIDSPSHRSFLTDFGQALAEHGDKFCVFSLLRAASDKEGRTGFETFEWIVLTLLPVLDFGAQGISESPTGDSPTGHATGHATGGSPTGHATGHATGASPTGHATGHATGGSPTGHATGHATGDTPTGSATDDGIFSFIPDYVQAVLDELVQYAAQLKELGAIDVFED